MRIEAVAARAGIEVDWRPFLPGPIFAGQGWTTSPFNVYPANGRYMWRDVAHRAEALDLPVPAVRAVERSTEAEEYRAPRPRRARPSHAGGDPLGKFEIVRADHSRDQERIDKDPDSDDQQTNAADHHNGQQD